MLPTPSGAVLQNVCRAGDVRLYSWLSQRLTKVDKGLITGISEVSTEPRRSVVALGQRRALPALV